MIDAHAHIGTDEEIRVRAQYGVRTMLCGTDPASAKAALDIASKNSLFTPCCALHPWKAALYRPEDMLPFLEKCPVVGETGLDDVWCDTPMRAQTEAFLWNLDYAERTRKPVVLHTKGKEREIARILKGYSVKKLVHWYSCGEPPADYLDQDCFFTIGPDAETNEAVRQVIELAPIDRLLTETDGMDAVSWAIGRKARVQELPDVLRASVRTVAQIRRMAVEEVARAIRRNYGALLEKEKSPDV